MHVSRWTHRLLSAALGTALGTALVAVPLRGQADSASSVRAAVPAPSPAPSPPPMITGGDLLKLGAFTALSVLAYQVDGPVRDATAGDGSHDDRFHYTLEQIGDIYSYGGAVGVGGAMWVGGLMADNKTVATTGLRALEAIFSAGVVAKTIKGIAGRARPALPPHEPNGFEWGRGFGVIDGEYESLPSGHATIVFAFASAVTGEVRRSAPQHLKKVAIASYGMAAITTYSRLHADEHWLSDLTLGAGIGLVSGWAVTRYHATRPENWVDRFFLHPVMTHDLRGGTRLGLLIETR
jgi:membrane-associated phospholipid phosphatase